MIKAKGKGEIDVGKKERNKEEDLAWRSTFLNENKKENSLW